MALPGVALFGSDGVALGAAGSLTVASGAGPLATQSTTNTAQAAQAGNATIKATAGRLFAVTVTATGTTPLVITDGAGGPVIFQLAASPALATLPVGVGGNVFSTSMIVVGSATNPNIVLHFA
jgi:hypothetical protein